MHRALEHDFDTCDNSHLKLYVRQWCVLHQVALIVKYQLSLLSSHYSDVAKLINTWRAVNNAVRLFRAWEMQFGRERALAVAKRLPPQAIKGRWGAIHAGETYILNAGFDQCYDAFHTAFVAKACG
eukprot:13137018-Alexandrium_andersonii.AAC.1